MIFDLPAHVYENSGLLFVFDTEDVLSSVVTLWT